MINALGHYVLVKQNPVIKKTGLSVLDEAGFEVAQTSEDRQRKENAVQIGIVASIGPTAWEAFGPDFRGEKQAKVGQTVFFPRHSGSKIRDPETGDELLLLLDTDIQVLITEGKNPEFELKEYTYHPDKGE